MCMPQDAFMPHMKDILQLLMMKLQQRKTTKYVSLLTHFFALFVGKFGPQAYLDQLNQIQPGLGLMLLVQVWVPHLQTTSPTRLEAKTQVVGLTKILCSPNFGPAFANGMVKGDNDDDAEIGYDATF